jgi:hypothetical protein
LLALLQRDVGHLARRGIDLIERAIDKRINLHGIKIAMARGLNACCVVGFGDAFLRVFRFWLGRGLAGQRLELAGKGKGLRQLDDLDRLGRIGLQDRRFQIVIADLRRLPVVGAAGDREGA